MSALSPLGHPVRRASAGVSPSGSPSTDVARADQIVHRFYIKTLAILVEGRLTHYAGSNAGLGQATAKESKLDKWFNLPLPEIELYKPDLQIYRAVSAAPPPNVPPLLIAFTLDTSDLLPSQALMWGTDGGGGASDQKFRLQMDKGKNGIILERWSFVATANDHSQPQPTASATYKAGIIHFRALYSLVRLMPAFKLYRRLRRANNGLRVGIKLWAPEGATELEEAWDIMEKGLVSINSPLSSLAAPEGSSMKKSFDTVPKKHTFPALTLLPGKFTLSTEYRAEADFTVQDMESVLSSKFARERDLDMDEEWFTPTVARQRLGSSAKPSPIPQSAISPASGSRSGNGSQAGSLSDRASQFLSSSPAAIAARMAAGQRQSSLGARGGNVPSRPASSSLGGVDRWGQLAEGLPFAAPVGAGDNRPSPPDAQRSRTSSLLSRDATSGSLSGASVTARRLSAHSIHPFKSGYTLSSSPSASVMRSTPPAGVPVGSRPISGAGSKPSSLGRTSSYLSQSGRSFTQLQPGNDSTSGVPTSPLSPSSASFSRLPSFAYRQASSSSTSPFVPSSIEKHDSAENPPSPSSTAAPQMIKRYSSSFGHRQGRLAGSAGSGNSALPGVRMDSSAGSSGEGSQLPAPGSGSGAVATRRLSGRISTEGPLVRKSLDSGGSSYSPSNMAAAAAISNDDDDISAFLKTLDSLPRPPSLAQPAYTSRPNLPAPSSPASDPATTPSQPSASSSIFGIGRQPITRSQVDATLQRLAGSYTRTARKSDDSLPSSYVTSGLRPTPGGSSPPSSGPSQASPPGASPLGSPHRPSPLSSPLRRPLTAVDRRRSDDVVQQPIAKSVPGQSSPAPGLFGRSLAANDSSGDRFRRGPVLLRGGFAQPGEVKSPTQGIRDLSRESPRGSLATARRGSSEGNAERELGSWSRAVQGPPSATTAASSRFVGQRTAPSSLGREDGRRWPADSRTNREQTPDDMQTTDEKGDGDESVEGILGRLEMTDTGRRA